MIYKIIKWITFLLIVITAISFFHQEGVKVFWFSSIFFFFGPRLENSMDRVYCGREIACHKTKFSDIAALFFVILELLADFVIN